VESLIARDGYFLTVSGHFFPTDKVSQRPTLHDTRKKQRDERLENNTGKGSETAYVPSKKRALLNRGSAEARSLCVVIIIIQVVRPATLETLKCRAAFASRLEFTSAIMGVVRGSVMHDQVGPIPALESAHRKRMGESSNRRA
jgi:hypothetical protein